MMMMMGIMIMVIMIMVIIIISIFDWGYEKILWDIKGYGHSKRLRTTALDSECMQSTKKKKKKK